MSLIKKKFFKKDILVLSFIFILSSLFRLTNLDLIEFKTDEASNLLLSMRPLLGYGFAPGGIATSVGILNFPLFNYLLFPFVMISTDPRFIVFVIALTNVASVSFFYWYIKKYYNFNIAIIASLLLAVSPWAILFSRKIWPPDIILPFSIFLLFCLHKIILDKKINFWVPAIILLLFIAQLDFAYIIFSFSVMLTLFLFKRQLFNYKLIAIGFLIGILPVIPYIFYQISTGCPDCAILLELNRKLAKEYSLQIFTRPLQLLGVGNYRYVLGTDTLVFSNQFPLIYKMRMLLYSEYILIPIGLILYFIKYKNLRFLVYASILMLILYFLLKIHPTMHYFVILVPLLFLFLAVSFAQMMKNSSAFLKKGAVLAVLLLLLSSISFNFAFFKILKENQGFQGDYGPTFKYTYNNALNDYKAYRNEKDFFEIILSSYIPSYLIKGDSSFMQMIYPYNKTARNINKLEEKMIKSKNPVDPRLTHQLIAFYAMDPKRETIDYLRKKTLKDHSYQLIYTQILNIYLQKNLDKIYINNFLKLVFEYPSHWILKEDDVYSISIKTDGGIIFIKKINPKDTPIIEKQIKEDAVLTKKSIKINEKKTYLYNCLIKQQFCGVEYIPLKINQHDYSVFYKPDYSSSIYHKGELESLKILIESMRT